MEETRNVSPCRNFLSFARPFPLSERPIPSLKKQVTLTAALLGFLSIGSTVFAGNSSHLDAYFEAAASKHNVNVYVLKAIASHETRATYRNDIVVENSDGTSDYCMMGINSSWERKFPGIIQSVNNPARCIDWGAFFLRDCLDRLGNTWEGIGCYNSNAPWKRLEYAEKIRKKLYEFDSQN